MVKRIATAFVLIALGCSAIFAQTSTASIVGVVRDSSGALIRGVTVNVKVDEKALKQQNVLVKNLNPGLRNCLRVTVGTPDENRILIAAMKEALA